MIFFLIFEKNNEYLLNFNLKGVTIYQFFKEWFIFFEQLKNNLMLYTKMLLLNVDVTVTQSVQKNATHVKLRNDSFDEIFTLYNITNSTSTST